MGKPFQDELRALSSTYQWAMKLNVSALTKAVGNCDAIPLVVVASGGSLTCAHFTALLHQNSFGMLAKAVTPLEASCTFPLLRSSAVFFLTAGGGNADVMGAFRQIVAREPARLIALCGTENSPLRKLACSFQNVDFIDFTLPHGRDGFLATNSLLAFEVLIARSYAAATSTRHHLPKLLKNLVHPGDTINRFTDRLRERCAPLWQRANLVVLYGPKLQSAAVDLESKFTEAALGAVQTADFRNFGHGRHHWLAKRGDSSAVLAIVGPDDQELAEKTLRLLPSTVPVARLDIGHSGAAGAIEAMVTCLYTTGIAGRERGIDPGRPGVPAFGRALYHLRGISSKINSSAPLSPLAAAAIERKTGMTIKRLSESGELARWETARIAFERKLAKATFGAVVLDYDGTLCDVRDRFVGLTQDVSAMLIRLLDKGGIVGIATGRGKSVREALQSALPRSLWERVFVGYYNGADVAPLSDDNRPMRGDPIEGLSTIAAAIRNDAVLKSVASYDFRTYQISASALPGISVHRLWDALQGAIAKANVPGVTLVMSAHSVDILASGVTKRSIIDRIKAASGTDGREVLCIGDRGRWPGNDYILLAYEYALSVDEVSADPLNCWNLAPPGVRGVQACIYYLRRLVPRLQGSFRLKLRGAATGRASS